MQANEESKRGKSKTEFVKTRERQESEDSCLEEASTPPGNNCKNQGGSEDVQAYINSIVPNNSIKFAKPTQSVSDLRSSCANFYIEIFVLNEGEKTV